MIKNCYCYCRFINNSNLKTLVQIIGLAAGHWIKEPAGDLFTKGLPPGCDFVPQRGIVEVYPINISYLSIDRYARLHKLEAVLYRAQVSARWGVDLGWWALEWGQRAHLGIKSWCEKCGAKVLPWPLSSLHTKFEGENRNWPV